MSTPRRTVKDGPTWVLCHGTPLTPSVWDGVAEILQLGGTVWRPEIEPVPGSTDVVGDIARRIVDGLPRTGSVHLVGHSFGGQVALEVALAAAPLVASLTLVCARDTPFPAFAAAAQALRRGVPADVDAALSRWFRPDELAAGGPVVDYARACLRAADPDRWAQCLDAIAGFDRSEASPALTLPVHLIAAEFDQVSTVTAMQEMARRIPHARLTVLADAAHMSAFRGPSALADLLSSAVADGAWVAPGGTV